MLPRLLVGLGVFFVGYFIGREVSKADMTGRDLPNPKKKRSGYTIDVKADDVNPDIS